MRIAAIVCSSCLCACAQTAPLNVAATGRGHACSLRVNGVEVSRDALDLNRLRSAAATHRNRAVIDTDQETPYRCIGGVIFDLQRAGFQVVTVTVNGRPIPSR
jgi:biopolymer transport protein ExbD